MLNYYLTQTTQLLANPAAPTALYATADLTTWINTARTQVAGETGCVRAIGQLALTTGVNTYNFSSITNLSSSVQGIYAVRQATLGSGSGQVYMGSRSYPWATTYWNSASPVQAQPTEWSQYGIGMTGSLIVNPVPNSSYTMYLDVTCEPIMLVTDATAEAIPYPYQDAVCYFAAYLAYMSSQRQEDADKMYQRYKEFVTRSRIISVPKVLAGQYDQIQTSPASMDSSSRGDQ